MTSPSSVNIAISITTPVEFLYEVIIGFILTHLKGGYPLSSVKTDSDT
jgi:hypothetical protein